MSAYAMRFAAAAGLYVKWAWPLLVLDVALTQFLGEGRAAWRSGLNLAAFLWVLCVPVSVLDLLLDRRRRESAMAGLCGLREGDERERAVTGEAAKATLLLGLALQLVLLVLTLVNAKLAYDPSAPKGERGALSIGLAFSSARHLDPSGPASGGAEGYFLSPSAFTPLLLLILVQLAAFKAFSLRRYEGEDA